MEIQEIQEIRRRLDELGQQLAKLAEQRSRPRSDFDRDAPLRKAVEGGLADAARACAAICRRIGAVQGAKPPLDDYQAILQMGELGVLTPQFAKEVAPIANVHQVVKQAYLGMKWDEVYNQLQRMNDLEKFQADIRRWVER